MGRAGVWSVIVGRATARSWCFFFFNDTATTEIYTLSLHDALPILPPGSPSRATVFTRHSSLPVAASYARSEEHTSELQSDLNLVCRLLLEKKKTNAKPHSPPPTEPGPPPT